MKALLLSGLLLVSGCGFSHQDRREYAEAALQTGILYAAAELQERMVKKGGFTREEATRFAVFVEAEARDLAAKILARFRGTP